MKKIIRTYEIWPAYYLSDVVSPTKEPVIEISEELIERLELADKEFRAVQNELYQLINLDDLGKL